MKAYIVHLDYGVYALFDHSGKLVGLDEYPIQNAWDRAERLGLQAEIAFQRWGNDTPSEKEMPSYFIKRGEAQIVAENPYLRCVSEFSQ